VHRNERGENDRGGIRGIFKDAHFLTIIPYLLDEGLLQVGLELVDVFIVDHPVFEHSFALMDPQQNHVVSFVFVVGRLGEHDAFSHFADFP
jgi:hypothetical protein